MSLLKQAVYNPLTGSLLRYVHRKPARILTYHRFPSAQTPNFTRQCEHLRRYYNPISLDELVSALREDRPLPPRSVVITIDDGYRDVFENGAPVLQRHAIPATLYAVSGFLDRQCWMWWDCISHAFLNSRRTQVELALPGLNPFTISLGDPESRREHATRISTYLVRLDNSQAPAWCAYIAQRLEVPLPEQPAPGYEAMSWDEARQLHSMGITIGAHSVNHWVVGTLPDLTQRQFEVTGGRRRLEEMLDRSVEHFSFPNGGVGDFSQADLALVREAGYASCCTTFYGMVGTNTDRFLLPRMNADTGMDLTLFEMKLAGLFQHMSSNLPTRSPLQ